jgi:periplasmic divalent cation tolerance protein
MTPILVLTTTSSKEEAEKIAQALLKERLVACVNIIENASSLFWWQGKINTEKESLLFMKTSEDLFPKLEEKLRSLHSYEVPEIIGLPITAVSESYKKWLGENLKANE